MKNRRAGLVIAGLLVWAGVLSLADCYAATFSAQGDNSSKKKQGVIRPIIVPVGIKVRGSRPEEIRSVDFNVTEDGDAQNLVSVRYDSPLYLTILIQDDLVSTVSLEIKGIQEFILNLPKGTRVMIGYIRSGSLDVRQKFTGDLERAAKALRTPVAAASAAPYNPYVEVLEGLSRFDAQPAGRRAMLLVSDGLDTSRGTDSSEPSQSLDLQRAINQAQRRSVAVYSIYAPSVVLAATNNQFLTGNAQSSLERLSSQTGGKAFFQGTGAPVSFNPFLKELDGYLDRQFALSYVSTHANKGFHRLQIRSATGGVELMYPAGHTK